MNVSVTLPLTTRIFSLPRFSMICSAVCFTLCCALPIGLFLLSVFVAIFAVCRVLITHYLQKHVPQLLETASLSLVTILWLLIKVTILTSVVLVLCSFLPLLKCFRARISFWVANLMET